MPSSEPTSGAAAGSLTLAQCYRFFIPLVLMVELNMISKSVIHAFLARTDDPSVALAAFNAAFTFYFALSSATEITAVLCLSYLKARADLARLAGFGAVVLSVPVAIALAVAFTPVGDALFARGFGLGAAATAQARDVVGFLTLSVPILVLRGTAFALLMMSRRTLVITWSTLVRLLSLSVSLVLLPTWLEGAAIGAAALVLCMAAETVFAWAFAWRQFWALPATRAAADMSYDRSADTWAGYWRFSWPLIINGSAEMGVIFVINLFLGRLADAELAIAAFGVAHGLISLMMAPMRNLTQTAQALVARRDDVWMVGVFTAQLVAFFTVLALVLFATPMNTVILSGPMGLTPELTAYAAPAMAASFAVAVFWAATALFRGLLAKARTTTSLAASGILRIATAAAAGALSLADPSFNGALLGVLAWVLSYVVETAISAWRLNRLDWFVDDPVRAPAGRRHAASSP